MIFIQKHQQESDVCTTRPQKKSPQMLDWNFVKKKNNEKSCHDFIIGTLLQNYTQITSPNSIALLKYGRLVINFKISCFIHGTRLVPVYNEYGRWSHVNCTGFTLYSSVAKKKCQTLTLSPRIEGYNKFDTGWNYYNITLLMRKYQHNA